MLLDRIMVPPICPVCSCCATREIGISLVTLFKCLRPSCCDVEGTLSFSPCRAGAECWNSVLFFCPTSKWNSLTRSSRLAVFWKRKLGFSLGSLHPLDRKCHCLPQDQDSWTYYRFPSADECVHVKCAAFCVHVKWLVYILLQCSWVLKWCNHQKYSAGCSAGWSAVCSAKMWDKKG